MLIPVSVAVITKNEEKNIEKLLESVKDFQEIVVVDSFSNDSTVEICKRYTDRIYQKAWEGFALQKQFAIEKTTLDWVLLVDADEVVTEELKMEIVERISNKNFDGYYIPRKNFFLGRWIRHSGWWPDYTLRLFKRQKGRMQIRQVHEKVIVEGKLGYLNSPLLHYTYNSLNEFITKMQNYSSLAADEVVKSDKKIYKIVLKMFFSPVFTFLKMYIFRLGFLDGIRGFLLAVLYSVYSFLKYAKAWERVCR